MHTNRLFLFASFAIVRSFFRLFAQYDYHINQCNTSLLNKHRIIYKIMRASLMQQDGHDTDRTRRHSTTATDSTDHTRIAMHHGRQDHPACRTALGGSYKCFHEPFCHRIEVFLYGQEAFLLQVYISDILVQERDCTTDASLSCTRI